MTVPRACLRSLAFALLATQPHLATQDGRAPSAQASPGYTLFSPMHSRVTFLVDANGEVVHTWRNDQPSAGAVTLLDDGHLLRSVRVPDNPVFSGGGQGGRIQELDRDGKVVWEFQLADERYLQHHDFEPTPHGTVLLLAWEKKSMDEALAAGRDPEGLRAGALWPEVVVEIEPLPPTGGRILWEWHVWDHLIQDRFPERANHGSVAEHPELLDLNADPHLNRPEDPRELADLRAIGYGGGEEDAGPARTPMGARGREWIHANALAYDPETDRILLCSRALSEIWVIDHSTTIEEAAGHTGGRHGRGGDFLARWGNPQNHRAGTEQDRRLFHPHDAHWIPYGLPGYGNVLLFNNGPHPVRGRSSEVLEIRLAGESETSREPVWSCTELGGAPFFSSLLSGAQRLPNGNTLVTIGVEARLVEVTSTGEVVWEYQHVPAPDELVPPEEHRHPPRIEGANEPDVRRPPRPGIFRATRIPLDHPGLARLERKADESAK